MNKGSVFQFHVPTKILFGRGQVKNLHSCALPGKKLLWNHSNLFWEYDREYFMCHKI